MKILLVDDNDFMILIQTKIIQKLDNVVVKSAIGGLKAIEILKSEVFDLIIMDCQMPDIDGFQSTQNIRQMGINTPILALTGDDCDESRKEAFESGMNGYLVKPIKLDLLRSEISVLGYEV